ncbi:MAG: phosphoribosylanthranilate isomerase [Cyclobacteriaceae bacterium]
MKIKVCGMREPENIKAVEALGPDFMGFIFYKKSKRFVGEDFDTSVLESLPKSINRVGVFVKEEVSVILEKVKKYKLDYVQLHGGESIETCQKVKSAGVKVIKVLSVSNQLPAANIKSFEDSVDLFLFDTETPEFGGSGQVFDWSILKGYPSRIPFLLSGGIGLNEVEKIKKLKFPQLLGIDVNSKFEIEPGLKDEALLNKLFKTFQAKVR